MGHLGADRRQGLIVLVAGLSLLTALAGCGAHQPAGPSAASSPKPAPAASPATTPAVAPPAAPPPLPQRGPTRVLGQPVVLRVTNAPKPGGANLTPQLLYVLTFRLSRNPIDESPDPVVSGAGRFSLAGFRFNEEVAVDEAAPDRSLCFSGLLDTENAPKSLRRLPDRTRVSVVLQPYDVLPNRKRRLGKRRRFRVPIISTDYLVNGVRAGQALLQIGCYTKRLINVAG